MIADKTMTIDEFELALQALGWKAADFCRATGLHRNTPSRWRNKAVEIPDWVPQHLGLLLDLKRFYVAHAVPPTQSGQDWYLQDRRRLHDAYVGFSAGASSDN